MKTSSIFLIAVLVIIGTYSPDQHAASKITWEIVPEYSDYELGSTTTVSASFKSHSHFENLTVEVTPGLEPFVKVSPSSFSLLSEDGEYFIEIEIAALSSSYLGPFDGTLHIKSGKKTISQPLPLAGMFTPATVSTDDVIVQYVVPEGWKQFENEQKGEAFLYSPEALEAKNEGSEMIPGEIILTLVDNPDGDSLAEFIGNFEDGWYGNYFDQYQTTVQGYSAVITDDSADPIPSSPSPAAFIAVDNIVIIIAANVTGSQIFENFLNSVEIMGGAL